MAVEIAVAVGDPAPVQIRPYEQAWPERFAACAGLVRAALGGCALRVDHIGSSAVPGLAGRPQLDIQVSVAEPDAEEEYRRPLEALGFSFWVREPDRRVFAAAPGILPAPAPRCETHVYICRYGGVLEYDQLLLVDYLVGHPERRDQYARLKRRLARAFREDTSAYAEAKQVFLRETVRMARRGRFEPRGAADEAL
jgi:GrpB-like predicted nucleotidyltransferase (UPF0157 family)